MITLQKMEMKLLSEAVAAQPERSSLSFGSSKRIATAAAAQESSSWSKRENITNHARQAATSDWVVALTEKVRATHAVKMLQILLICWLETKVSWLTSNEAAHENEIKTRCACHGMIQL